MISDDFSDISPLAQKQLNPENEFTKIFVFFLVFMGQIF